jgi:hypothetical protein
MNQNIHKKIWYTSPIPPGRGQGLCGHDFTLVINNNHQESNLVADKQATNHAMGISEPNNLLKLDHNPGNWWTGHQQMSLNQPAC